MHKPIYIINTLIVAALLFLPIRAAYADTESCGSCPLSAATKNILEEALQRTSKEAAWIVSQSNGEQFRAYSHNLLGMPLSHEGVFVAAENCSALQPLSSFCEPCAAGSACEGFQRCSEFTCEAPGKDSLKVWWQPAPLEYSADSNSLPNAKISYSSAPEKILHFNTSASQITIDWTESDAVKVLVGRETVNASNMLTGHGVSSENRNSASINLRYPALACTREETKLDISLANGIVSAGTVRVKNQVLGRIVNNANGAKVNWSGACR